MSNFFLLCVCVCVLGLVFCCCCCCWLIFFVLFCFGVCIFGWSWLHTPPPPHPADWNYFSSWQNFWSDRGGCYEFRLPNKIPTSLRAVRCVLCVCVYVQRMTSTTSWPAALPQRSTAMRMWRRPCCCCWLGEWISHPKEWRSEVTDVIIMIIIVLSSSSSSSIPPREWRSAWLTVVSRYFVQLTDFRGDLSCCLSCLSRSQSPPPHLPLLSLSPPPTTLVCVCVSLSLSPPFSLFRCWQISRVPNQNGVSQAWCIVQIHHSGREPSIYNIWSSIY